MALAARREKQDEGEMNMNRILKEYTYKEVCGSYLKSRLSDLADSCEDEDEAMSFRETAQALDENKRYTERITREYFEDDNAKYS